MGGRGRGARRLCWANVRPVSVSPPPWFHVWLTVLAFAAVDYLRGLLQRRQELLARLSGAYDVAQEARVVIKGNHRVWDEQWDEGEQAEAEPEADWSEDDR